MPEVRIDYVTLRLNENFDFHAFTRWVQEPRYDKKTGELQPPIMATDQFRVKTINSDTVVVSFYNGSEPHAVRLWRKYHLPVTRVDLCIDTDFTDQAQAEQQFEGVDHDLMEWHSQPGNDDISTFRFDGRQTNKNGEFGRTMYSRQSDHHLRVYEKRKVLEHKTRTLNTYGLRYEWQLKGDLAKEVFPIVCKGYPNNSEVLFDVFQSITARWLEPDFFHLGDFNSLEFTSRKNRELTNFEQWIRLTIPRALYREFKTSGIDYRTVIAEEFDRIMFADSQDKAAKVKGKLQTTIEATYHNIRKKVKSEDLLRPEPEDTDEY